MRKVFSEITSLIFGNITMKKIIMNVIFTSNSAILKITRLSNKYFFIINIIFFMYYF